MAQNRWVGKWSYGYSGTDNAEIYLLTDELGLTEEEVEAMSDSEAEEQLSRIIWEAAVEQVEAWCRPAEEDETSWNNIQNDN